MRFKDEPQNDDDLHRAVARNAAELYGSRNDSSRFIAFYRRSFLTGSRLGARLRFKKCSTEFLFRFFYCVSRWRTGRRTGSLVSVVRRRSSRSRSSYSRSFFLF